ncbi:MAG: redox-sensitive transcriptional activator SoxR [Oceanicaulis sp.]
MQSAKRTLTIGEMARRTGLSVSAIRFYEEKGLVTPERSDSGQRRFARADLRRLSFVLAAQRLGLSLDEIGAALASLPADRAPSKADWSRVAAQIDDKLARQIAMLENLRSKLDGCIGCGCLSLEACALYNRDDKASAEGPGPRLVVRDDPA